jgi:Ser/Thr protein kinase RdoA (MazF antagonist)
MLNKTHELKQVLVDAFVKGYQQRRQLSRAECEAIPYFELVAVIWVMAIHAKNVNRIGY